jgi:endoglucanase
MYQFGLLGCLALAVGKAVSQNCSSTFTPITASKAFAELNPGWNLGNTLDATPDEGSWNNPPVQAVTFDQIKAKGFKSVRIPGISSYSRY